MKNNSVVNNNNNNNSSNKWTYIVVSFSCSIVCAIVSFCCGIVTPLIKNELILQMSAARINGVPGYYVNFRKLVSTSSSSAYTNVNNNNYDHCNDDTILSNYLTDNHTVLGYHLVCVTTKIVTNTNSNIDDDDDVLTTKDDTSSTTGSSSISTSKVITLHFYSNGLKQRTTSMTYVNNIPTWDDLHFMVSSIFHLPKQKSADKNDNRRNKMTNEKEYIQPWVIFTPDGQYIINEKGESYLSNANDKNNNNDSTTTKQKEQQLKQQSNKIVQSILLNTKKIGGMFVLYENGQFIWPGIRIGYTRTNVQLYTIMPKDSIIHFPQKVQYVTIQTLSLQPLLFSIEIVNNNNNNNNRPFLSNKECNHIVELYADTESTTGSRTTETESTTIILPKTVTDTTMLLNIDYRIASLVRIPRQNQEQLKISINNNNNYNINNNDNDNDIGTMDNHTHRIVTVFMYLTTVTDGGETMFLFNPTQQQQQQQQQEQQHQSQLSSIDDYCSHDYNNNNNNNNNDNDDITIIKIKQEYGKIIFMYHLLPNGTIDPFLLQLQKIITCPVLSSSSTTRNSNQLQIPPVVVAIKHIWNKPMTYVPP